MIIKKSIFLLSMLTASLMIGSQDLSSKSIIVLYGCSSAGKTSIATELLKILPGDWKYIASNQFRNSNGNLSLWNEINRTVSAGQNVIVDTHSSSFLVDPSLNAQTIIVLLYCSPEKLIEHVSKRNTNEDQKTHREIKGVLHEYDTKFKSVKKSEDYIDIINKASLKKSLGFFASISLRSFINKFFNGNDQRVAFIAPFFKKYDCLINTGKSSIPQSAQKIKQSLMLKLEK